MTPLAMLVRVSWATRARVAAVQDLVDGGEEGCVADVDVGFCFVRGEEGDGEVGVEGHGDVGAWEVDGIWDGGSGRRNE
jgi:hypothetical protein